MKTYMVAWDIDIDADSPEEAARKAREIQLDPHSLATVFTVIDEAGVVRIDLMELENTCLAQKTLAS